MATSISNTKARFTTKCGQPLAGGKVYAYEVGTTTPKQTYTDSQKKSVNTHPVVLDIAGSANIFLDGAYRVQVFDRRGILIDDIQFTESWISASEKHDLITKIDESNSSLNDAINAEINRAEDTEKKLSDDIELKASIAYVDETVEKSTSILNENKADKTYVDQLVINANAGLVNYKTEVELLAFTPSQINYTAKALDTKKVWLWDGKWNDTGLSEYDLAKEYVKFSYIMKDDLMLENLNDVVTTGVYFQKATENATTENNYPINKAGKLEVFCPNIYGSQFIYQRYTTLDNEEYLRVKYYTYDFQLWKKTASSKDLSDLESKSIITKPNLTTENLNTITTPGLYRQLTDSNATTTNGYPNIANAAGTLFVTNISGFVTQELTTWYGRKFWRTKYGNYDFLTWNEVVKQLDISKAVLVKTALTTENLNDVVAIGIYRQISNAAALASLNYPVDLSSGVLEVTSENQFVKQTYTTWTGRQFWRTKYSTYAFQSWKEVAKVSDIASSAYKDKKIAWFGDSIVNGNSHPLSVGTNLQATVSKFGFNGCTMSKNAGSLDGYDKLTMYRFAKAIDTGDFSEVISGAEYLKVNNNLDFTAQANAMSQVDWAAIDYIMIAFGTNDWAGSTPLGSDLVADETGSTYVGATCYVIETILQKYPHIQIMFVGPSFRTRWFNDRPEQNSETVTDAQGKKLIEYQDALIKVGEKYHLPVFDMYRNNGVNIFNYKQYFSDGVHPNSIGTQLWTKKLTAFLVSN